jgi:hypothetical protein
VRVTSPVTPVPSTIAHAQPAILKQPTENLNPIFDFRRSDKLTHAGSAHNARNVGYRHEIAAPNTIASVVHSEYGLMGPVENRSKVPSTGTKVLPLA